MLAAGRSASSRAPASSTACRFRRASAPLVRRYSGGWCFVKTLLQPALTGAACGLRLACNADEGGPIMFRSKDVDPQETREWLEALDAVLRHDGRERAEHLIGELLDRARRRGVPLEV